MDTIIERMARGPIAFDGAIGTQLYERGLFVNKIFEGANLDRPDLVRRVHGDYAAAGAEVLTSNTFSGNRLKLAKHGLEEQVGAINRAGARLAREAAGPERFVAGSVGPSGRTPSMLTSREEAEVRAAFREQIEALCEEGVDLICLETFRQLSEIRIAIKAALEVGGAPVVASVALDADGRSAEGAEPARIALLLEEWGASVIGANCIEGPNSLFEPAKALVEACSLPVLIQPNAGYPRQVANRLMYMATPEYFGVWARRFFQAGVTAVGGCCGTGPEHVRRIASASRMVGASHEPEALALRPARARPTEIEGEICPTPDSERSRLAAKITRAWRERVRPPQGDEPAALSRETFAVSVEVNPPRGLSVEAAVTAAGRLIAAGVDVINIADGPRASVRMSNWALAAEVAKLGAESILHVCARDRNLLGLQADLLAYHVLGMRNLVVITGDPPKLGDYPHATAVFDLDSVGILRMIDGFNRGLDPAHKPVGQATSFFCACGAEPAAHDYERELRRLEAKKEAGASLIMTQPVYDPGLLRRFLDDTAHLDLPVLVGLLPLASSRNAEFLHNEVPGMSVPEGVRRRMRQAEGGERARREGILIARETLDEVAADVVGAYIMPPFGRYESALRVLEGIEGYKGWDEADE